MMSAAPKTKQQILEEILEDFLIAIKRAEMEAMARLHVDYHGPTGLNIDKIFQREKKS